MLEAIVTAFGAGLAIGYVARDRRDRDDRDEIDRFLDEQERELRERYQTGPMDYVEFGDRIALLETPDTERIMRDAVDVDGIGPTTALEVARQFESYGAFRDAGRDDYEAVNGIGEQKGRALAARH